MLYGWDDFAGRRGRCRGKLLDWTEDKRDWPASLNSSLMRARIIFAAIQFLTLQKTFSVC